MSKFRLGLFENVMHRLKKIYNYETDKRIADHLGVNRSVISSWRAGKSRIDYELIFEKFPELRPGWIIDGLGYPFKNQNNPTIVRRYHLIKSLEYLINHDVSLMEIKYRGEVVVGLKENLDYIFEIIANIVEDPVASNIKSTEKIPDYLYNYFLYSLTSEKYEQMVMHSHYDFINELVEHIQGLPNEYEIVICELLESEENRKKAHDNESEVNSEMTRNSGISYESLFQDYLEKFTNYVNDHMKDYRLEKK